MDISVKTTPKDFFQQLLAVAVLFVSIVSFIALMFAYIETLLPNPLTDSYDSALNQIRWSSSVLLVVFAVFIFLSWLIGKTYRLTPEKRELKIRKWLTYFTLFIAAIAIIIDLVTLLYNFYSGEYTGQFILKVFVVFVTAGGVFWYYFWDLKREAIDSKLPKTLGWMVSLALAVAIIGGFFIVGSPATQRARRFDQQRVNDLQNIQNEVVAFWQNKDRLPNSLDNLVNNISGFIPPKDPQTNQPYEYKIIGKLDFNLCANFTTANNNAAGDKTVPQIYPNPYRQNWNHANGRVCFDRTIDPQIYNRLKVQPL